MCGVLGVFLGNKSATIFSVLTNLESFWGYLFSKKVITNVSMFAVWVVSVILCKLASWLSQDMHINPWTVDLLYFSSSCLNHSLPWAAAAKAIYFTSVVDNVTVRCFSLNQEIAAPWNKKMYAVYNLLSWSVA